jgi:hypothetical protein
MMRRRISGGRMGRLRSGGGVVARRAERTPDLSTGEAASGVSGEVEYLLGLRERGGVGHAFHALAMVTE